MDVDPDIAALRSANRRPIWIGLAVVAGALLLAGLWVVRGAGAVRADLEAEGHTDVEVKIKGPFELSYEAKKGNMVCGGHVTRLPFSTSKSGTCFGTQAPAAAAKPAIPENEELAGNLRTQFPTLPVSTVRCAAIPPGAPEATCTLESDGGTPLEVKLDRDGGRWTIKSPERIISRTTLGEALAKELQEKVKAPVTVDCGTGLFGYADKDKLSCAARRQTAKKDGKLEVTFAGEGYTWTATGI